ncbi:MAG: ABC transporter permease [Acidimicrobiia bacterium]
MRTVVRLTGRYLAEYARRPLNLVLLLAVPLVFVSLSAGAIADFAEAVGGVADASQLDATTAAWAAAFIAGVAGFFHVLGSREADRRLAAAGMGAGRVVSARLVSGLILSLLAAAAALVALAAATGIDEPARAVAGSLMAAFIYLGIGALVGALVRSDVNGSLVVVFIWMFDVFLGPAMAGSDVWITRLFPTHFPTLVILDSPSDYAGPVGDLGWALIWTFGSLLLAGFVFAATTQGPREKTPIRGAGWKRLAAGLRFGFRDYRRNIAMWVLLILLPVLFISLSFYVTPDELAPLELTENGVTSIELISMVDLHGAIMVPITIGFLAGLAGLFVVQGSIEADARLSLAGFKPRELLGVRLGIITLAALVTTAVSLGVTAVDFEPRSWGWFILSNAAVAITYGMLGVLVGIVFGRLGGLYVMFLLPFIDVGLGQNIMFSAAPPDWGALLPARGAVRVMVDAAFTPTLDVTGDVYLAGGWLAVLGLATALAFWRLARPSRA